MDKYRRLAKNTFLVFIGNFGSKLISVFMLPFYTTWLSLEAYGELDMINVYVSLLLGFVTFSIAESIFVFPKDQPFEKQKQYFSSGIFISSISLIITGIIFKLIHLYFIGKGLQNVFLDHIWSIYFILLSSFFCAYFQQFARSIDKMKIYTTTGVVVTFVIASTSYFFIKYFGLDGYVYSMILANIIGAIYCFVFSKAYLYLSLFHVKKIVYLEMLKYSIPLIPNRLMWWFIGYFNRPFLEKSVGLDSIGLIAVANKYPSMVVMVFGIFFNSWQISVLEEFKDKNYNLFYNKVFKLLIAFICFLSMTLSMFSKEIVELTTGKDFHGAWIYIPILTIAPIFQAISSFSSVNFIASKDSKYIFYGSLVGAIASIITNVIFIPIYGVWGAVISIIASQICMAIARVFYSLKYVKISNIRENLINIALAMILPVLVTLAPNTFTRYLIAGLIISTYFLINKKELRIVLTKLRKL
jgi:O-antigen/teichoic acid export membrane protein